MLFNELLDTLQNLTGFKISQQMIADVLNVRQGAISNRITRKSHLTLEELQTIEQHYGVDLTGNVKSAALTELNYYPDVFASCGKGVMVLDETAEKISVNKNSIPDYSESARYSVINVRGWSMQPVLFDNDKVIIKHWQGEQIIDNKIYLFSYKGELFIKRLVKNIDQVLAISEDKTFEPRELKTDDLNILGRVISLIRTDL